MLLAKLRLATEEVNADSKALVKRLLDAGINLEFVQYALTY
jgi:hypothetical protein